MRQPRRQPLGGPARRCAHVIVGPPACRCACCAAWLHGPPHATAPAQRAPGRAHRGRTARVSVDGGGSPGPCAHEPDGALRQACLAQRHTVTGTPIRAGPRRPCRPRPPRPLGGGQVRHHRCHRARRVVWPHHHALRTRCACLAGCLVHGPGRLEPTACLRSTRPQGCEAHPRLDGVQRVRALPREALCHTVRAWQAPLVPQGLPPSGGPRRLALTRPLLGGRCLWRDARSTPRSTTPPAGTTAWPRGPPPAGTPPRPPPPGPCSPWPRVPPSGRATPTPSVPFVTQPVASNSTSPSGSPNASATSCWSCHRICASSQRTSLSNRCSPRRGPPATWRAIGSIDVRSRFLHGPTLSSKTWARGSRRAKQAWKADGNSPSASMTPATSLGTRANVGIAQPAPPVRQAGNLGRLLVICGVYRRSIPSGCP